MPTVIIDGDGVFGFGRHRLGAGKYATNDPELIRALLNANLDWAYVVDDSGRVIREVPEHVADDLATYKIEEAPKDNLSGTFTTADFGNAAKKASVSNANRRTKKASSTDEPALTDA